VGTVLTLVLLLDKDPLGATAARLAETASAGAGFSDSSSGDQLE